MLWLLPSPCSHHHLLFSPDVQNGLLENNRSFFVCLFVCLRMDLAVEYPEHGMCCQFPSSGICHSSAPSSEKQDERLDFFGITCLGSCIMALLTSLGTLALSHLCTAVSVGAWTAVHTSGVALVSVQHTGPLRRRASVR